MLLRENRTGLSIPKRHRSSVIIIAGDAQSLIIEQNRIPIIQFDILPFPLKNWLHGVKYSADDYYLNFLFKESFRDPHLFAHGLRLLIDYMLAISDIRFIYTSLLQPDKYIEGQLTTIGSEFTGFLPFHIDHDPLYRLNLRNSDVSRDWDELFPEGPLNRIPDKHPRCQVN